MSNNKQSSIDWLINEHFGGIENCTPNFRHKIKQAKAMHKEEIMEAHYAPKYGSFSEQYYNETFGSNNENRISETSNT